LRETLSAAGVDVTALASPPGSSTGAALVLVTPDGENAIIVTRAQDSLPTTEDIDAAAELVHSAAATVVQLELSAGVLDRAVTLAGGKSSGHSRRHPHFRQFCQGWTSSWSTHGKRGRCSALPPMTCKVAQRAAANALTTLGPSAAVVTLGADGAAYAADGRAQVVPAEQVSVTDTTGAGDAALGAFALSLARGEGLHEATKLRPRSSLARQPSSSPAQR
jgi:ribokinase